MKFKLFIEGMKMPAKAHTPDIGFDLFMPESFEIKPLETKTISLGLGVAIPEGFAGMLVPRSSVAAKGLIIQTSIIDPAYTGEIHLIVTNCSSKEQHVDAGMRLCSLVVYSVLNPYVEIVKELEPTVRGNNGLGSTGL